MSHIHIATNAIMPNHNGLSPPSNHEQDSPEQVGAEHCQPESEAEPEIVAVGVPESEEPAQASQILLPSCL
ncbi:hypothetical protein E6H23_04350 [Candidatus Bathyarchaeota archaeon]|nr:MAG: hypothetical protein E6H23_04350 [Candidatus Bathyarchaeota archaeon]